MRECNAEQIHFKRDKNGDIKKCKCTVKKNPEIFKMRSIGRPKARGRN